MTFLHRSDQKFYLAPGGFYFGGGNIHVHTLLGSCISITLWHPRRQIGGICHFVLSRDTAAQDSRKLDPRYAEDAVELFARKAARAGTALSEYEAKIFGGSNTFDSGVNPEMDRNDSPGVGERNRIAAFELISPTGAQIKSAHIGEFGHRRLIFDLSCGDVWVKFTPRTGQPGNTRSLSGRH